MDTVIVKPRCRKPAPVKNLPEDRYFIALTGQIESGMKPSISSEHVERALSSGRVSPDVIDDLEDTMLGAIMEERCDDETVSVDEVLDFLRK